MAGAAFTDKDVLDALENFTPILVDGDVEKKITGKYKVSGYPHVIFANAKGESVGNVSGAVSASSFLAKAKSAAKKAGKPRPSKDYKTLTKADAELTKALGKKQYGKALTQIAAIEKVGRAGRILDRAKAERAVIEKSAAEKVGAAQQLFDDEKYAESLEAARAVLKEFRGVKATEASAKKLIAEAKAKTEAN